MKKIFTLSFSALLLGLFLSGCVKDYNGLDESYYLSQERGEVVYSDPYCSYYVVETAYGYTVLRSYGSYKPYQTDIVYGDFSNYGNRDFYNRSTGRVFSAQVEEYWLSYFEAQDAVYYYCPYAKQQKVMAPGASSAK